MKGKTRLMYTGGLIAGVALTFSLMSKTPVKAQSEDDGEGQSRIERGFEVAPVKLNLHGKDRALVGLAATLSMYRPSAMAVTAQAPRRNSLRTRTCEAHFLFLPRRLMLRRTWVAAGTSVR